MNHSSHFAPAPILTLRDVTEVRTTAVADTDPSDDRHKVQIRALPQLQPDLCCFMDALIKDKHKSHHKYVRRCTDLRSWPLLLSFQSFNKTQFYIFIKILSLFPCFLILVDVKCFFGDFIYFNFLPSDTTMQTKSSSHLRLKCQQMSFSCKAVHDYWHVNPEKKAQK